MKAGPWRLCDANGDGGKGDAKCGDDDDGGDDDSDDHDETDDGHRDAKYGMTSTLLMIRAMITTDGKST